MAPPISLSLFADRSRQALMHRRDFHVLGRYNLWFIVCFVAATAISTSDGWRINFMLVVAKAGEVGGPVAPRRMRLDKGEACKLTVTYKVFLSHKNRPFIINNL